MAFDADEYLAALEPPRFRFRGREYTGRLLSVEEWEPFRGRLASLDADGEDVGELRDLLREFVDTLFPREWWRVWRPRVSDLFLTLPFGAQLAAFQDFVQAQARAMQQQAPTPGSNSRPGAKGKRAASGKA